MMKLLDDDYDGTIKYNEFVKIINGNVKISGDTISLHDSEVGSNVYRPPTGPSLQTPRSPSDPLYHIQMKPAGAPPKMFAGAHETATPGQWRLPAQWAQQPFPEALRRFCA